MTKLELKLLAADVSLMDKLNTVSGLIEMGNPDNRATIDALVTEIYLELKDRGGVSSPKQNKIFLLSELKRLNPAVYEAVKDKRFSVIRYEYSKLTNTDKQ